MQVGKEVRLPWQQPERNLFFLVDILLLDGHFYKIDLTD